MSPVCSRAMASTRPWPRSRRAQPRGTSAGRGRWLVLVQKVALFDLYPTPTAVAERDTFYAAIHSARALYRHTRSTRYWDVLE